jgi:chemotaxis protein MotB
VAEKSTVIVRRVKKIQAAAHHGGAWKVAYADFVTAMMAFFLVMWLVGATTTKQRESISEYFRNPSPLVGRSPAPAPGMNGPGGASNSMIKLGGTMEIPRGQGPDPFNKKAAGRTEEERKAEEKRQLESLMQDLQEAIAKSQALEPFKDQLLLDLTPDGLRIQIVDQQNRPMFDMGSAKLKDYTGGLLGELATFINQVPNHISVTGHTDTTAYNNVRGYSNWELSADRANAARRALVEGGMAEEKVSRVVGLSSSVLFDKTNPQNPINRRISIVVMTHDAEQALLGDKGHPLTAGPVLPDADTQMPESVVPAASAATAGAVLADASTVVKPTDAPGVATGFPSAPAAHEPQP